MVCTCVDTDAENIKTMARAYPDDWDFRIEDAWVFAEQAAASSRVWDVVSVDPFFEDCARKVWESLDLWLLLAGDMMTLTVHADTELAADGWTSSYFPRGHDVGWMVFRRD